MKFLIWLGVLATASFLTTALAMKGVRLGAIPTVLIYGAAYALAKHWCRRYDENHRTGEALQDNSEKTDAPDDETMK